METVTDQLLFINLDQMEETHNVALHVCAAEKHPDNPVLPLGDIGEWDSGQAGPWQSRSVLYDEEEQLFKAWYSGTDITLKPGWSTGYAFSEDGIHWIKPKLGLVDHNGSTDNNLVLRGVGPVVKDDDEADAQRRYKMIVKGPTGAHGIRAAYSPDGIQWREGAAVDLDVWREADGSQSIDLTRPSDVVALVLDREAAPARRFTMIWQAYANADKPGPELARTKCIGFGADVENFRANPDNPILHPNDGLEQENHFLMLARQAGWHLLLYEYGWYMPDGTGKFGRYSGDIRLAASSDGQRFARVQPHQKVIERGPRGAWDSQFIVIADKPIVKEGRVLLYYAGSGEEWSSWPTFGNRPETASLPNTGCLRPFRMGLATLRVDGFTCMETTDRETPGFFTTAPLESTGGRLSVNVGSVQPGRSWVEVEVLDPATGAPFPGFSRAETEPVARDSVEVAVHWRDKGGGDLPAGSIQLRFHLCGAARLYSCRIRDARS